MTWKTPFYAAVVGRRNDSCFSDLTAHLYFIIEAPQRKIIVECERDFYQAVIFQILMGVKLKGVRIKE